MKFISFLLMLIATTNFFLSYSQEKLNSAHWGIAANSSYRGRHASIAITPTCIFYKNRNQFEIGFGLHPFDGKKLRTLSSEINYRHFNEGFDDKINLYYTINFSYINERLETTYMPPTYTSWYNNLILMGGCGLQFKLMKGLFIASDLKIGGITTNMSSENLSLQPLYLFNNLTHITSFSLNCGYRF